MLQETPVVLNTTVCRPEKQLSNKATVNLSRASCWYPLFAMRINSKLSANKFAQCQSILCLETI